MGHVLVDLGIERIDHPGGDPAYSVFETPGRLRCGRQLRAGHEELVLKGEDVYQPVPPGCRRTSPAPRPIRRAGLVKRSVGVGALSPDFSTRPPYQSGRPVIALLRVDLDHTLILEEQGSVVRLKVGAWGWSLSCLTVARSGDDSVTTLLTVTTRDAS